MPMPTTMTTTLSSKCTLNRSHARASRQTKWTDICTHSLSKLPPPPRLSHPRSSSSSSTRLRHPLANECQNSYPYRVAAQGERPNPIATIPSPEVQGPARQKDESRRHLHISAPQQYRALSVTHHPGSSTLLLSLHHRHYRRHSCVCPL